MELGVMMKEYSQFPKASELEPHHLMSLYHIRDTHSREMSYPSAEIHWAYFTVSTVAVFEIHKQSSPRNEQKKNPELAYIVTLLIGTKH